MNRKETRILVENWRKVLSGSLNDSEQELIKEGIKEVLLGAGLALGASLFLNPNVGHTLNGDEVAKGLKSAFSSAGRSVTVDIISPTSIKITNDDTGKSFTYTMPDTSGFEGSYFDEWFKLNIKTISDWKAFLDESETLGYNSHEEDGKNLFISGGNNNSFSGAQYRSDLTEANSSLLSSLNNLCEMSKSEIFQLANGRLIIIGYTQKNMPITWVDFDKELLEIAANKMKQDNKMKRNQERGQATQWKDLRRVVEKIKAGKN